MIETLYLAAGLLAATAGLAAIARHFDLPTPIVLVLGGLAFALVPGLPAVRLEPDAVLLLFLPPLIYYAAFGMSWQAFRDNLRPILSLAVGCVLFTTVAVAAAAHWIIGMSWAVGFVLGAVVSPPDVVAPLAIARRLGIPRRVTAVLEGEGLVNDATALVVFSFAVAAVTTGSFSPGRAALTFAAVVIGETAYGFAVGWIIIRLRHRAHDPRIEVTLSLLTPFLAFWLPHAAGGSGVLATVVCGLYVGWKSGALVRSNTRLQALFIWDLVAYVIEGAVFLLTGLQARGVVASLQGARWDMLLVYALIVSFVVIAIRFVWVYPATYIPRWISPRLAAEDPSPSWKYPFIIAFTGIRGVVSLAAALSIPLTVGAGEPFPERSLILFLTFSVILVTLVCQGLTLRGVVERLGLVAFGHKEREEAEERELAALVETNRAALDLLEKAAHDPQAPADAVEPIRAGRRDRLHLLRNRQGNDGDGGKVAEARRDIELALIEAERGRLNELLDEGVIGDDVRRRIERDLDLREERIRRNFAGLAS